MSDAALHDLLVQRVAYEYRGKSYLVIVEPAPDALPAVVGAYRPDLVAVSPSESVVVEVKVKGDRSPSERFGELARRIGEQPGWPFALVIGDPVDAGQLPVEGPFEGLPVGGRFALGSKLIEMGSRAIAQLNLVVSATPYLRRVAKETGETAQLAVPSGNPVMSIASVPGSWTLTTPSTVGLRSHIHCTSGGKVLIAFLPDDRLERLLARIKLVPHTRKTITSAQQLRTELQRIRRRGYAIEDEELEEGLRCIGAPVRNYTGTVVASLSIAGPVVRFSKGRIPVLSRAVLKAADDLSAELGWVRPHNYQNPLNT